VATEAEGRIRDIVLEALRGEPNLAGSCVMKKVGGQRVILHFKDFDNIEVRVRQLKPKEENR
jgi:hypothetical protein